MLPDVTRGIEIGDALDWRIHTRVLGLPANDAACKPYSSDMALAWPLVVIIRNRGYWFALEEITSDGNQTWCANFDSSERVFLLPVGCEPDFEGEGATPSEAICRAVLNAVAER